MKKEVREKSERGKLITCKVIYTRWSFMFSSKPRQHEEKKWTYKWNSLVESEVSEKIWMFKKSRQIEPACPVDPLDLEDNFFQVNYVWLREISNSQNARTINSDRKLVNNKKDRRFIKSAKVIIPYHKYYRNNMLPVAKTIHWSNLVHLSSMYKKWTWSPNTKKKMFTDSDVKPTQFCNIII